MNEQAQQHAALFEAALVIRDRLADNPNSGFVRFLYYCLVNAPQSSAQLLQDLFVLFTLGEKRNGYFVEFGATNGMDLSNSFLLERQFSWEGILAEPARSWHDALAKNRKANIDFRCVWKSSAEFVSFNETQMPEFSTIESFSYDDYHAPDRRFGQTYAVETVSLNDLLQFHGAPRAIDYLSIDTEGSELDILSQFNFDRYDVSVITVEHNYVDALRGGIHDLLSSKGYIHTCLELSRWDDWYVKPQFIGMQG